MRDVSFIIAAYNAEEYIVDAIESCLINDALADIEVCVVDDGSNDGTYSILCDFARTESRLVVDRFPENRGKVAAFNRAYELSQGELVLIMSADDLCIANRLPLAQEWINRADIVAGNVKPFKVGIEYNSLLKHREAVWLDSQENILRPQVYGATIAGKRDRLDRIFPLPEWLSHEDWYIPTVATLLGMTVVVLPDTVLKYRLHEGQSSRPRRWQSFSHWRSHQQRDLVYFQYLQCKFSYDQQVKQALEYRIAMANRFDKNFKVRMSSYFIVEIENKYTLLSLKTILALINPKIYYYISCLKKTLLSR